MAMSGLLAKHQMREWHGSVSTLTGAISVQMITGEGMMPQSSVGTLVIHITTLDLDLVQLLLN